MKTKNRENQLGRSLRTLTVAAAAIIVLFCSASLWAQNLGWEGETGIFITPVAYTAGAEGKVAEPVIVYLVATKTVTQTKPIPIVLSAGVRGTDAELWGMGGNAPNWQARGFGAMAFVFKAPKASTIILGFELSQQPLHPQYLPTANFPTSLVYAIRFVPTPKQKLNVDFGIAQIAGQISPGVNLQARSQVGVQVSYGF